MKSSKKGHLFQDRYKSEAVLEENRKKIGTAIMSDPFSSYRESNKPFGF